MITTPFGMKCIEHNTETIAVMRGNTRIIELMYDIFSRLGPRSEGLAELVPQQARIGVREDGGAPRGFRAGKGGRVEPGEGSAVSDQTHRAVVLDLHSEASRIPLAGEASAAAARGI